MTWLQRLCTALALSVLAPFLASGAAADTVWRLDIDGAIGPATADYTVRGLESAAENGATAVLLRIDTPGGLDKAMRDIVKAVVNSTVPVIGYVAPSGARAASAGTYILYACHIAAMAPATNLGSATPVQIGGGGGLPTPTPTPEGEPEKETPEPKSAMEKKIINDAVAYIRGLAELRGRNAEWAEKAVREGVSLSADAALQQQVIDLIAESQTDLLKQVDGREVTAGERSITLATADAEVHRQEPDWRSEFLSVITDPNVAYILLLIGIYGLIFEFSNPGMGVPGIVGAICLLLALYALQVLPISYSGLGLMLLGIVLMIAEAFAPSFGVLGFGGIVAFVIGSIILMDSELPGYQIAWPVIAAVTAFSATLMIMVLGLLVKSRRKAVVTGLQHLVGESASVETIIDGQPYVRVEGELWRVHCDDALAVNDRVSITGATGVTLDVSKLSGGEA